MVTWTQYKNAGRVFDMARSILSLLLKADIDAKMDVMLPVTVLTFYARKPHPGIHTEISHQLIENWLTGLDTVSCVQQWMTSLLEHQHPQPENE